MPPLPRQRLRRLFPLPALAAVALVAQVLAAPPAVGAGPGPRLRLASWNLEWLLTPQAHAELAPRCTGNGEGVRPAARSIPCDVAAGLERSATDFAALARYARQLDADVVALQEVDGIAAARQVFPGYDFCFTGGPVVQNTGFALRAGLPHRCEADLGALSLGDTLRRGAVLVLYPGTSREVHLLGVHLKSGCARGSLAARQKACARLARQLPALAGWIHQQESLGHRYALLGDFNRDLEAEQRSLPQRGVEGVWAVLAGAAGAAGLRDVAAGMRYANCWRGQPHSGYIDYILLGGRLAASVEAGSFQRMGYGASEAWRLKLSDHCPVAVGLRLD